ncbi:hypothetical protein [Burkholderia cepacia]|uniref:hypothetical protein n=1 Tax=Burkholderia cepacia TaxID=292 RepID=UPI00158B9D83|nr:hypothetical protein [Burkholderia cepacia]
MHDFNDVRLATEQELNDVIQDAVNGLHDIKLSAIVKHELEYWECFIKPWVNETQYHERIRNILLKCGHDVSTDYIRVILSRTAKEIGFDRKTRKLDGRKRTRK